MKAALRSIPDIREWFFQMKLPYWSLWNGHGKDLKDRAAYNSVIQDLDESWEVLENTLNRKSPSGGRLTVFVTEKWGSSVGATEFIEFANQISGIQSINSPGQFGIGGKSMEVYIAEQVDAKIESIEKDRRIAELEAALKEKETGSGINALLNRIGNNFPVETVLVDVINKFLGINSTVPPATAINGTPERAELTQQQMDMINDALARINNHFEDVPGCLQKLATWIEKNPLMAKSLLANL